MKSYEWENKKWNQVKNLNKHFTEKKLQAFIK